MITTYQHCRFVKKETREFFGLDEGTEETQRQRWEEKRRRLASRKYGQLKENTTSLSASLSASAAAGFGVGVGGRSVYERLSLQLRINLIPNMQPYIQMLGNLIFNNEKSHISV